jgi:hypothetical protein
MHVILNCMTRLVFGPRKNSRDKFSVIDHYGTQVEAHLRIWSVFTEIKNSINMILPQSKNIRRLTSFKFDQVYI